MEGSCARAMPAPCYGKYYVYSSSPVLSHADRPRKPKPTQTKKSGTCFANHATNIRTRGAHEFYNMMWDPSVYRGNTTRPYYSSEIDRCNKKRREMDPSIKRRRFPRKQNLAGGIVRPRLTLADQEDKVGLEDMGMQTEQFLEEITSEVAKKEMSTQVEEDADDRSKKNTGANMFRPFMIGTSQTCQTDLKLTFPFAENVKPIQKQLGQKIIEQALLETTEEMELEAVRKEKRKYILERSEEIYKLRRDEDAQRAVAEERELDAYARDLEYKWEQEAESRLCATLFSAGCMGGMLPITFGHLQVDGYLSQTCSKDMYDKLMPYLDMETRNAYAGKQLVSRKLLDEMLQNVTSQREAEMALGEYGNEIQSSSASNQQSLVLSEDDHTTDHHPVRFSLSSSKKSIAKSKSKPRAYNARFEIEE